MTASEQNKSHPANYDDFFLNLLTHDISNYNQTTRGYLEMLINGQMGQVTEEQRRPLIICLRQTYRIQNLISAARLINDLQDRPLKRQAISLEDTIEQARLAVQSTFPDHDIRFTYQPAKRQVMADEHLYEVFFNLLSNAVRHSDKDPVEIVIAITTAGEDGKMWQITITDNGDGIPPNKQEMVLERLIQREVHGSGIGLSLVKYLVNRWEGKIELIPHPAGGPGMFVNFQLPKA